LTPSTDTTETLSAEDLSLSSITPVAPSRPRKRVGRGMGSGKGRYSGRGIKGQKSRSGSHKMRAGFEGGQMPIYMRLGKLRGATSKDAMPIGPHRTSTQPVNVRDLERVFDDGAEVTLDALLDKGLINNLRTDVKLLGDGSLTKSLTVTVHRASSSARDKIGAAGGTITELKEPKPKRRRRRRRRRGTDGGASTSGGTPESPDESTEVDASVSDSAAENTEPDAPEASVDSNETEG